MDHFDFVGAHPVGDSAWTPKVRIAHGVGSYKKPNRPRGGLLQECTSL